MKAVIFKKNNLYKFKGGYGKMVELKIKKKPTECNADKNSAV